MFKKRTYLDIAAGWSGNPSSPHAEGRKSREQLEGARSAIARLVEAKPDDVLFTSGATEANALAILGHIRALRARAGADTPGRNHFHAFYLPSAHASIVENMSLLSDEGVSVEPLPLAGARVDIGALRGMLRKETVLVAMEAVCGETGVVWNTREVAQALREFSAGAVRAAPVLHVDASQAPLTEKMTRAHFGADSLALDGAKVGAMHGIGALIVPRSVPLEPLYRGGGQERRLRPGTETPELAEAFAEGLRRAAQGRERFRVRAERDRARLVATITKMIPDVLINEGSDKAGQAPNILNLSLPGRDTDYLVALLDETGFAVSTRSACETDSEEGSRAVYALTGDPERARSTLRVSWGPAVRWRNLARFSRSLARSVAFSSEERFAAGKN